MESTELSVIREHMSTLASEIRAARKLSEERDSRILATLEPIAEMARKDHDRIQEHEVMIGSWAWTKWASGASILISLTALFLLVAMRGSLH